MEKTLVLKFGGASLKDLSHFENVAAIIVEESKKYDRVCVVVSAIDGVTDYLNSLAAQVHDNPSRREKDMLLSVGERISMSLLAMKLSEKGIEAVSMTGSQAGIITTNEHSDAKVIEMRPRRLEALFQKGQIPIIAGFQGMSLEGEITTLGRGGSDTSAVALAVALDGEKVVFYKDVEGVFSKDPKRHEDAFVFSTLSYDQALDVVGSGAQAVLHPRSVMLAAKNGIVLHVKSFDKKCEGKKGSLIFSIEEVKRDSEKIYEEALCSTKEVK